MNDSEDLVLALDAPTATLATVGGKGASLARLSCAGVDVPGGFHVTTAAYREFVAKSGLRPVLLDTVHAADPDDPAALDAAAALISSHFLEAPVPGPVSEAVRAAYADLGPRAEAPRVAVRSSATAEDLPDLSFAGQQESFLNISGGDSVVDTVRRCWASLWTARAIGYRARHGIGSDDIAMAVVVQELVDADAAGVLFTCDPVTGARDRIVVNAAWGLGEAVVGGLVTPDTVVASREDPTVTEEHVGDKTVMTVRDPSGTQDVRVPDELRTRPVLDTGAAVGLVRTALRVEELYGTPVDIEWARADGRFHVLQARPVTVSGKATAPAARVEAEVWNDSLGTDQLWTSTNVGEAVPAVMTPATWSLIGIWLSRVAPIADVPGVTMNANIGGRWYANYSVSVVFGGLGSVQQVYGTLPDGLEIPPPPLPRSVLFRKLLGAVLPDLPRRLPYLRDTWTKLDRVPELCAHTRARIAAARTPGELAGVWRSDLAPFLDYVGLTTWASFRRGGLGAVSLRMWLVKRGVPEADINALVNASGTGAGELMASLGPVAGIARLARGEMDREEFVRDWGHRCPEEFELSVPRPDEDPGWIDRQVAGLDEGGFDIDAVLERQHAAQQEALRRFADRRPGDVRRLRARMASAAVSFRGREAGRSEWVRAIGVTRAFLLRAGELTGIGDDVFFLKADEVVDLLGGDESPLERVPARRAAYDRYRALPTYPRYIRGPFAPEAWAADPDRRTDFYDGSTDQEDPAVPEGAELRGFAGAAGVVEATARVVASAREGERLRPGEILVAPVTNVGWTPLFPRAAAVVTDVGAPLSHAAIVARELGIPAVVGCGDATTRLTTGDRVRVNGGDGTVEVVARGTLEEEADDIHP